MKARVKLKPYPSWVCYDCAMGAGGRDDGSDCTFHQGQCDVCGRERMVTEPRDYGYPSFPQHERRPTYRLYDYLSALERNGR